MGKTYKPKFDIGTKVQTKDSSITGTICKINIDILHITYDVMNEASSHVHCNMLEKDLISIPKYQENDLVYLIYHDTIYQGIITNIITLEDQSIRYYVRILQDGEYYNKCCLPEELFDSPEPLIEYLKNNIIPWNPNTK